MIEYYENGGDNRISFDMAGSLLPVRLLDFTGKAQDRSVELQWNIAPGSNPNYFEIERSHDAQHFTSIAKLDAGSNSTNFKFTDNRALPGNSYYRLKISDLDGNKTFSGIITVKSKLPTEIIIYPTVVQNNQLFISSGSMLRDLSVTLFDLSGKKISNYHFSLVSAGQTVLIPLDRARGSGIHFVEVRTANERKTKQVMILK